MAAVLGKRLGRVYWGWWVIAANSAIAFVGGFHLYGTTVFFLPLTESMGMSRARLSLIFAAARLEGGVEGPLVGWLIDRIGPRQLMMGGAIVTGVGYILLATVVHDFWTLFIVYTVFISTGFSAGFFAPLMASVNKWFVRRRSIAIGIVGSFIRGSAFILAPLLSLLVLNFGWRTGAFIAGVIMMGTVLLVAWVNRPSPESMGLLPDGDTPGTAGAKPGQAAVRRAHAHRVRQHDFSANEALRTSSFWLLVVAQGARFLTAGALMVHLIPILVWKGFDRQAAANLVGLMAAIGVPCVLFFGWAGDRFTMRYVAAAAALVGAAGLAFLAFTNQVWLVYPFIVLNAVAESSFPVIIGMTGEYFGRRSFATLRGITQSVTAATGFATTLLAGWVFDKTGSYTLALIPLTIAAAAAVPVFLLAKPPRPPAAAPASPGSIGTEAPARE